MALKYDDYAEKQLNEELEEAQERTSERQEAEDSGFEMPKKFAGKSAEEIARAYVEQEKLASRHQTDLHRYRTLADQLLELQAVAPQKTEEKKVQSKPISLDEIYEAPDEAVRRAAREASQEYTDDIRKKLNELDKREKLAELTRRYPEWQQTVQSEEFLSWVREKPLRVRLAREADGWNVESADALLEMWTEANPQEAESSKQEEKRQRVKAASLESGGAAGRLKEPAKAYSRTELMELRLAAKRGDQKAERYLKQHSSAIQQAYLEGRIVD